jgi:hypothetical protein
MQNMQKCFILLDRHAAPRQCRPERLLQPEGLRRDALPAGVVAAAAAVARAGGSGGTGAVRRRHWLALAQMEGPQSSNESE